ncbi:MAG TPA: amidohydrolase family protein [Pseudonocardiaceae bacterium]|nr:amidohydrolase family protein [Pseudonocardiaceae bacterium]
MKHTVVDAQVHIWAANSAERPWVVEGRTHRDTPLGADELLAEMDVAGVDAAILVPPTFEGYRNDLVLAAAARHPSRFGVMGRIALDDPVAGEPMVRGWREQPGALGFRLVLSAGSDVNHPQGGSWLLDGSADWFWPVAQECGVPVMLHCIDLLDEVAGIADRHPRLKIVIDHLGLPTSARDAEVGRRVEDLVPLADRPNIAVKAGSIPCYTTESYPYPAMRGYLRRVVDLFGASRVCWASDISRLPCDYATLVRFFATEPFLDDDERELVLGRGLCEWLDWNPALPKEN